MRRLLLSMVVLGAACAPGEGPGPQVLFQEAGVQTGESPSSSEPWYVFGPDARVQASSLELAKVVPEHRRLHVAAVPSPDGVSALSLLEESFPRNRWGDVLIPAERRIFAAFAADPALGDWLVIFSDVRVMRGVDPLPATGYRWTRAEVKAYAACGIPPSEIDECTRSFFRSADAVMFAPGLGERSR